MTVRISLPNILEVLSGVRATDAQIDEAIGYAVGRAALAVEGRAKENASGRPGPNVRTGSLRRSILASPVSKGFDGRYTATVSAFMEYARAVEQGHPNWKPGVKYPYLRPAAEDLSSSGRLNAIFTDALVSRLGG